MHRLLLPLLLLWTNTDSVPAPQGRIQGVVVNGTHGNEPMADVDVILRWSGPCAGACETYTNGYLR